MERADQIMAERKRERTHALLLNGIATGITTAVVIAIILMSVEFSSAMIYPIALAGAAAVFGVFMFKIYKIRRQVQRPAETEIQPIKESASAADDIPERVIEHIERCLILAAPTHGVLQDRLNYWLSGNYGTIKSTAMTSTDKGFFLSIIYEQKTVKELTNQQAGELVDKQRKLTDKQGGTDSKEGNLTKTKLDDLDS